MRLPGSLNNPLPKALLFVGAMFVAVCLAPAGVISVIAAGAGEPEPSVTRTNNGAQTQAPITGATSAITAPPPTGTPPVATTTTSFHTGTYVPPPTATTTYHHNVRPGAFCKPRWAFGYTSAGTLMQCKPSATDSRFRWRKV